MRKFTFLIIAFCFISSVPNVWAQGLAINTTGTA